MCGILSNVFYTLFSMHFILPCMLHILCNVLHSVYATFVNIICIVLCAFFSLHCMLCTAAKNNVLQEGSHLKWRQNTSGIIAISLQNPLERLNPGWINLFLVYHGKWHGGPSHADCRCSGMLHCFPVLGTWLCQNNYTRRCSCSSHPSRYQRTHLLLNFNPLGFLLKRCLDLLVAIVPSLP